MSATTHARIAPHRDSIHLSDLDPATRAAVEDALEDSRLARDHAAFADAQQLLANRLNTALPASGALALCTCLCGCDAIHNAARSRIWQPGDGTERTQCPDCADDHRITD